jgi:hypothetical protein
MGNARGFMSANGFRTWGLTTGTLPLEHPPKHPLPLAFRRLLEGLDDLEHDNERGVDGADEYALHALQSLLGLVPVLPPDLDLAEPGLPHHGNTPLDFLVISPPLLNPG